MHSSYNKNPAVKFFVNLAEIIPIAQKNEDPKILRHAYENILKALSGGHVVCLFPEGGITYDGKRKPFKKGIEKISKTAQVNVIPMALYGFWGGITSRAELHKPLWKRKWGFWRKAILKIGKPIPYSEVQTEALQQITEELIHEIKYDK
jgi:1-acyl-sn-glycerol-3-phosphate acyltransferase